jgi:hypothetical protein
VLNSGEIINETQKDASGTGFFGLVSKWRQPRFERHGGATTTMQTVTLRAGDIDNNNVINQLDALTIGMNYNLASPTAADLNNDGTINVLDLELLAGNYGQSGSLNWLPQ